jgi:Domain of unknown function (DUF4386)
VSVEVGAGILLIVAPLWFNASFALLGNRFDYPDILRRPAGEILERFRAGGSSLIILWWAFMLSGLLLIAGSVLLGQVLGFGGIVAVATTFGVLAGLVQMLGLLRWVYLVPALARAYADPALNADQREVQAAVFRALHQYLGVGVGEHLGYLFTGLWSVLIGVGHPDHSPTYLAGLARDRHRRRTSGRLRGVPRSQRRTGMESRRSRDPRPLHCLVHLAARDGYLVDRLIFQAAQAVADGRDDAPGVRTVLRMEERRPPKVHAPSDARSDAMQVLTTEHWSLLATRSQAFNEAFARAGLFLTILTGSVVALALVAQASEFDERFTTFALVLMPVVLFIGMSTLVRLVQNNFEDVQWVIGMNRIRHAYLEREPDLARYFVTSPHDDETGVMTTLGATPWREQMRGTHAFVTTPGCWRSSTPRSPA